MHFFLHGGVGSPDTEKNKTFYQAFTSVGSKILIVPFSQWTEKDIPFGEEEEKQFYEKWMNIILRYNLDKQLEFQCAKRDIPTLIKQIKHADILFFCGGKAASHLEVMDKVPDLKWLIQDKVIVGNSAWSAMRARAYYRASAASEGVMEGNGILPIKMMVHRWANRYSWLLDEERLKILEEYGEKLPIYKIPEQEFIEFVI